MISCFVWKPPYITQPNCRAGRSEKNEKTGKYNFQSANQKNVLTALAAYFIVCNRIYEEICEISATPKKLLKSKLFLYVKNGE